MHRENNSLQVKCALVCAVMLAVLPLTSEAGDNSTTLPNGASLEISIDDPVTCTEFIVPSGQTSIDVGLNGAAAVGLGEPDATFVYVIDTSGSTSTGSGTGCSPILNCEKNFFINLNNAVVSDGSSDQVGIVRYGSSASIPLSLTHPTSGSVNATISGLSASGGTNCTDALIRARQLVLSSSNGTNTVVFASDGYCNTGGDLTSARNALAATGATVYSIAIGSGSDCDTNGGTGTLREIAANGGACYERADPGNLDGLIENLIGSSLDSLALEIDGGGANQIPNGLISLDLPQDGAIGVTYTSTATSLTPADHELCVTAYGSDVTGGTADVTQCETIHLLQLDFGPGTLPGDINDINDLNFETDHTVAVQIAGGIGPERPIDFAVTGQNAGAAGSVAVTPPDDVTFNYSVPPVCDSLGLDTITATTVIATVTDSIVFTKEWIDTVPPDLSCDPTVNPHGNNVPPAGNTNPDGFYQLNTEDPTLDCPVILTFGGWGWLCLRRTVRSGRQNQIHPGRRCTPEAKEDRGKQRKLGSDQMAPDRPRRLDSHFHRLVWQLVLGCLPGSTAAKIEFSLRTN